MHRLITLLSDFGTEDAYVGVMKGVILSIAPQTTIVDLTHCVGRHAIRQAAFLLAGSVRYFPPETIHLVVVDPGVGSNRRALACQTQRAFYIGPDNGVLSLALAEDPPVCLVELTNPKYRLQNVSSTFHGRDIFAPAAAYLARGIPVSEFGPTAGDFIRLSLPEVRIHEDGSLGGTVIHVDRFGNCITNISAAMVHRLGPSVCFETGTIVIESLSPTYSSVAPGEPLALVGSMGYVEIAVREGSAAERLKLRVDSDILCRSCPRTKTGRQS
ncbi:MAG: SAM-dependent chlorinase/fluorinase [Kiritimatiellae bacterium]|nr:SAM-dependent chlorinase/fluorinase [Kiritimatiellia bacterium]